MNEDRASGTMSDDRAWVSVDTPLGVAELAAFCGDVERLLRLNPCLEFKEWQWLEPGSRAEMSGTNRANGTSFAATLEVSPVGTGMVMEWGGVLKCRTIVAVEPLPTGSRLTLTDDYSDRSEQDRQDRAGEIDTSLVPWGRELHRFLASWKRWSRLPGWHWWMDRFWLPLRPSTRRIARMLILITAAEFAALAILLTVLRLEGAG